VETRYLVENILACPKCKSNLQFKGEKIVCNRVESHCFTLNNYGIIEFAEKKTPDKYDNEAYVRSYFGDAYGHQAVNISNNKRRFIGVGQPEGLYRTANQLALKSIIESKLFVKNTFFILDVACGLGRRLRDLATLFSNAQAVGFDYSSQMIRYASDVLIHNKHLTIDLSNSGFDNLQLIGHGLKNVFLAQADARNLPINISLGNRDFNGFDIIFNCMLIDRIEQPDGIEMAIKQTISALSPEGYIIFCCPFNWITKEAWEYFGKKRDFILEIFESNNLRLLDVFDGLIYRELLDPHGTHLELPVLFARCQKII